ncbi:DMT family transporter [Pseudoduganella sp.]|uniref:DMT family transporter n=1 Tax=Pseudoduganella sp. TaxID=1880898 RepID=UPI0035B06E3A
MPSSILFVAACVIWGSTFWAITLQLGQVAPTISIVYRFAMASSVLFAWCLLRGDKLRLSWAAQRWTILQGCCSFGLSYIGTYFAEQYVVSALVAVLFALMVFWNPILSRFVFGTPLTWRTWAAGSVAVGGVVLLFYHAIAESLRDVLAGGQGHFILGIVLALGATIASTVGNTLVVKVRQHESNVLLSMAWGMLWGTVLVTLFALVRGDSFAVPTTLSYWGGLIYLSLFGSVIAFACYFTLIDRIGTQKAVYIGVVTPVLSVLISIQLENFRPGWMEVAGMVMCLASVAWALKAPSAPARPAVIEPELLKKAV